MRVFLESQDKKPQSKPKFEISLSQQQNQHFLPLGLALPQGEAGPSRSPKQLCIEQQWHGNLQRDAQALAILLQIECVEPDTPGVTFEVCFEGLNIDQYI